MEDTLERLDNDDFRQNQQLFALTLAVEALHAFVWLVPLTPTNSRGNVSNSAPPLLCRVAQLELTRYLACYLQ